MKTVLKLEVRGNTYDVTYPNTGQQIDMELLKAKIADGNYDTLRFSNNPLFQDSADKIDMIATFSVLIPQLKKDINVDSFFKLEEEVTQELLEIYSLKFIPWYTELKKAIREPKSQLHKEEEVRDIISSKEEEQA